MNERVLCVISGFPASGKTTLLNSAIVDRVPLFGLWSDHLFTLERWRPSFEKMSGLGRMAVTPVEYRWISQAIGKVGAEFPPRGVLHMDLSVASDLQHFAYDRYRDSDFLNERFAARLNNLYSRYDKVILNNIHVDLDTVAIRYAERCKRKFGRVLWRYDNFMRLYKQLDYATYDAITNAWMRFSQTRAFQIFETSWGSGYAIKVVKIK